MTGKTWKMIVEFASPEAALEWADGLHAAGLLPNGVEFFEADALDLDGRAPSRTYIARASADRHHTTALRALVAQRDEAAVRGGEQARAKVSKVRHAPPSSPGAPS